MEIENKRIVFVAKEIINRLYMTITEGSTQLIVTADISELAKGINVSESRIRLSLHYLIMMGYITAVNESFNIDTYGMADFIIHPGVIDRLEDNRVFS